jgi:histone-lysine N-methyltransferase MLL3
LVYHETRILDGAEHSVKSTTPGLSNIPSSSMSGNRDKADESKHDHARMFHSSDQIPSRLKAERLSTSSQATERWEEDEPLGDKATKAAVLYANVHHSELKVKFPLWQTRAKAINRKFKLVSIDRWKTS